MREEFEKLPEIAIVFEGLHPTIIWFCKNANQYATSFSGFDNRVTWLNGAWYAFQEQQKKIDEHSKKLKMFIDELKKTHNDDKDNKIDYWRGFSDCADSSVKVFLRDVGFIE